jgi:fructosamine-3-kinase
VLDASRAAGGDVNRAERMTLADGRDLFVKHRAGAEPGMYAAEAAGLAWLAEAGALRTPSPGHDEELGRGLAALHLAGAPAFGLAEDNFIGPLAQPNAPSEDWPEFYGGRRLEPMARAAVEAGELGAGFLARLERLRARLPDLCGPAEPPARLHGDLWGGNAMTDAEGRPVLIDPAAYGGHREVDLAMMRLFGGFGAATFAAYAEGHPLAEGHGDRVELYQLYPVLVHVVLFGGGYARSAERILGRYAG